MSGLALVMPMAGRGSRFSRLGITTPKPMIELAGKPFFWWAAESVRRAAAVRRLVFVVLDEHCRDHGIDACIAAHYPEAEVVRIPEVTAGAAETAAIGVEAVRDAGPVAINDCDHAFLCPGLGTAETVLAAEAEMALLCFRSTSPAYSYAMLDGAGRPTGTVEKVVASPFAIAGCYMFADAPLFHRAFAEYRRDCPYDELFVSGMFNRGARLAKFDAARHWSFGTPDELAATDGAALARELTGKDSACLPPT